LIFSRAGQSVAFLWVPFLFPQKEMEQNKFAIPVAVDRKNDIRCGRITNPTEQGYKSAQTENSF